jgi:hypothetical protein
MSMTGALIYKEFRETLPIAALGLTALLLVALEAMGYSPVPNLFSYQQAGRIPFVGYYDAFVGHFRMAAGGLALALGLWQSLGDFWGDAQLFVLHRPTCRRLIYGVKLGVGLLTYLICAAVPILLYAAWANTPGTHASPFEWSMTGGAWLAWLSMVTLYLGAFLTGIRPASWIGTRLAPLAAAGALLMVPTMIALVASSAALLLSLLLMVVVDVALAISILHVLRVRNFA